MAEDRIIRGQMRNSETVNSWPIPVRYFWTQLWGYCDDWGRGYHDARLIVAGCFPLDDEVTASVVTGWMKALEKSGVITPYEVEGRRYFQCINWGEHQDRKYKKKSAIPAPSESFETLPKSSTGIGVGVGKGNGAGSASALAPYCSRHPGGTDRPCGPCRTARLAFEATSKAATVKPVTATPKRYKPNDGHPHRVPPGGEHCELCETRVT